MVKAVVGSVWGRVGWFGKESVDLERAVESAETPVVDGIAALYFWVSEI